MWTAISAGKLSWPSVHDFNKQQMNGPTRYKQILLLGNIINMRITGHVSRREFVQIGIFVADVKKKVLGDFEIGTLLDELNQDPDILMISLINSNYYMLTVPGMNW